MWNVAWELLMSAFLANRRADGRICKKKGVYYGTKKAV